MDSILFIAILFVAATFLFVIIGITINDMRTVRLHNGLRRHPYARKWRNRPTISVLNPDALTEESRTAINRSSYRKIIMDDTNLTGDLLLQAPQSAIIERSAIMHAVQYFNGQPTRKTVELLPLLNTFPNTTISLFRSHHTILSAPFAAMRAGYGISPVLSVFPRIDHCQIAKPLATITYDISRRVLQSIHITLLVYVFYLAIVISQPALLLAYISCFLLWAIWSIGRYPYLSFMQKIHYFTLLPVSGIYFVYRLATAPFRFAPRHAHPRNAMIGT